MTISITAPAVTAAWNDALVSPGPPPRHRCRTVGTLDPDRATGRLAYLSLVSDLTDTAAIRWFDADGRATPTKPADVAQRLLDGEVVAVIYATGGSAGSGHTPAVFASDDFHAAQMEARRRRMLVKNLLLQAGLEEVSTTRGASAATIDRLRGEWLAGHALTVDVAGELAQGAARQRYVDPDHKQHSRIRLSGLEQLLAGLGIRSNTFLTL